MRDTGKIGSIVTGFVTRCPFLDTILYILWGGPGGSIRVAQAEALGRPGWKHKGGPGGSVRAARAEALGRPR